jgi:hypothetical protein
MVGNQFLSHPLLKIGHIYLSMVVLVNEMHISKKFTNSPSVQHLKSVYQVHIGMSAHDFIILLIFAKCYVLHHLGNISVLNKWGSTGRNVSVSGQHCKR